MTCISSARDRLEQAGDLAEVLEAAYEAFEGMLSVIGPCEDPASGWFAAFVMAAASAADGRDAVAFAPSLPAHAVRRAPAVGDQPCGASPGDVADAVAGLGQLAAHRLGEAARSAREAGDRAACQDAARCARDICGLLGGSAP
jgi:hypothetical protein